LTDKDDEYLEQDDLFFLRTVPLEYGFRFTIGDVYQGVTATSLEDFVTKLEQVSLDSVCAHFFRGDFYRWISEAIGDKFLAAQLSYIIADQTGEELRKELLQLLDRRVQDLKSQRLI
jgi:hypothetical protein